MGKNIIKYGCFIAAFLFFASPLAANLDSFHHRIIRVAFINGYVRALQNDIDKIARMKDDKMALKKRVELEAEKYIEEVTELTKKGDKSEAEEKGVGGLQIN